MKLGSFTRSRSYLKQGIKTPKREMDLVKDRLKRLKEALR
jgi:phage-related protein